MLQMLLMGLGQSGRGSPDPSNLQGGSTLQTNQEELKMQMLRLQVVSAVGHGLCKVYGPLRL